MSKTISLGYMNSHNENRSVVVQNHRGMPITTASLLSINNAWKGNFTLFKEWVENALNNGNTYGYSDIMDTVADDYAADARYHYGDGYILSEFGIIVYIDNEQYAFFDYAGKGELI